MINGFKDKEAEKIFNSERSRKLPGDIQPTARRKLLYLNRARNLDDLKAPPGNRLEALSGNRKGQYSIRINSQWRICFTWSGSGVDNVEIVDYH